MESKYIEVDNAKIVIDKIIAKKILDTMFGNYTFGINFTINDDVLCFEIDTTNPDMENNTVTLYLEQNNNVINIELLKRSENKVIIGIYYIDKEYFYRSNNFWEDMFAEHLQF